MASVLRRFKLINSHIQDGSRNLLPLTALRQYDLSFRELFVYFLPVVGRHSLYRNY